MLFKLDEFIRSHYEHLVAPVTLGILTVVLQLQLWAVIGPALGVAVGGILLLLFNVHPNSDQDEIMISQSTSSYKIPIIIFSLYIVALLLIYYSVIGHRPILHYPLLAGMVGFIGYQIYAGYRRELVLTQILFVGLSTYLTGQLAYPAGAVGTDTRVFYSATLAIFKQGTVPPDIVYPDRPGHMVYVVEVARITGMNVRTVYYSLSFIPVTLAPLIIGTYDKVINAISTRTALYAALLFTFSSFTIKRATYVGKITYFTLAVVTIIYLLYLFSTRDKKKTSVAAISCLFMYLMTGHNWSSGAAVFVSVAIISGVILSRVTSRHTIPPLSGAIVVGMTIMLVVYPSIETSSILPRIATLVNSLITAPKPSSGGRYSSLNLIILINSTISQAILLGLGVFGTGMLVKLRGWKTDGVVLWVAFGGVLLGISVVSGVGVIPKPRIYWLLLIFGLNIAAGWGILKLSRVSGNYGRIVVFLFFAVFVIFSITSPIAGIALTPYQDDIPHTRNFNTAPERANAQWESDFTNEQYLKMRGPGNEVPLKWTDQSQSLSIIDRRDITLGILYEYSTLGIRSGVIFKSTGTNLGSRVYAFVKMTPCSGFDHKVYDSSHSHVYQRTSIRCLE